MCITLFLYVEYISECRAMFSSGVYFEALQHSVAPARGRSLLTQLKKAQAFSQKVPRGGMPISSEAEAENSSSGKAVT